jgi:hypothetical protein
MALFYCHGATTFSRITLHVMPFDRLALSVMAFERMPLSVMIFNVHAQNLVTFNKMSLVIEIFDKMTNAIVTFDKMTQLNDGIIAHCLVIFSRMINSLTTIVRMTQKFIPASLPPELRHFLFTYGITNLTFYTHGYRLTLPSSTSFSPSLFNSHYPT